MAKLIDGKAIAAEIESEVKNAVLRFQAGNVRIGLTVLIIGNDPSSEIYIRNKEKACARVGIRSSVVRLPQSVDTETVIRTIAGLNQDPGVHGILVQQPFPPGLLGEQIIESIDPRKDVDGFHPLTMGRLFRGFHTVAPCTPAGIIHILDHEGIKLDGKRLTVVGRSTVVGKPVALLCLQRNATVTICHSRSGDLSQFTRSADVLIVAVGQANLIRGDMVSDGVVIVDVGMNRIFRDEPASDLYPKDSPERIALDSKGSVLVGDVFRPEVEPKVSFYTPVPGGVGQVTVAMLLRNTVTLAEAAF